LFVTPAKAGVHGAVWNPRPAWIPAFAGMTGDEYDALKMLHSFPDSL